MPFDLRLDRDRRNVFWCDRCGRVVNSNDEREHFHIEQCGACRKFRKIDKDWGWCVNRESVYCGRPMFEHDTCSKYVEGKWK
jgi:hypothetical protein